MRRHLALPFLFAPAAGALVFTACAGTGDPVGPAAEPPEAREPLPVGAARAEPPAAPPAAAPSPPPVPPEARDLIRRLGGDDYRDREAAQAALARMGRAVKPAVLAAAAHDPSDEVRARCAAVLRGRYLDYDYTRPGAELFRRCAGAAPGGPQLHAEVTRSADNRDLLSAVEAGKAEGGKALAARRLRVYHTMFRPSPGGGSLQAVPDPADVAAVLVAEVAISSADIPVPREYGWVTGCHLVDGTSYQDVFTSGPHPAAHKAIFGRWLDTRSTPAELDPLPLAFGHLRLEGFEERLPALRRVVATPGVNGRAKGDAMWQLTGFPNNAGTPAVEAALTDATAVHAVRLPGPDGTVGARQTQVRDLALAFLLYAAGQDIASYGFETDSKEPRFKDPDWVSWGYYAFASDEKRAAAMARYAAWKGRQGGR
ncbi:MAG: hypothetical protein C0501_05500 [Isosphaera sp.]|nr:hypothetical protein [Isosphaera sp.]